MCNPVVIDYTTYKGHTHTHARTHARTHTHTHTHTANDKVKYKSRSEADQPINAHHTPADGAINTEFCADDKLLIMIRY